MWREAAIHQINVRALGTAESTHYQPLLSNDSNLQLPSQTWLTPSPIAVAVTATAIAVWQGSVRLLVQWPPLPPLILAK